MLTLKYTRCLATVWVDYRLLYSDKGFSIILFIKGKSVSPTQMTPKLGVVGVYSFPPKKLPSTPQKNVNTFFSSQLWLKQEEENLKKKKKSKMLTPCPQKSSQHHFIIGGGQENFTQQHFNKIKPQAPSPPKKIDWLLFFILGLCFGTLFLGFNVLVMIGWACIQNFITLAL